MRAVVLPLYGNKSPISLWYVYLYLHSGMIDLPGLGWHSFGQTHQRLATLLRLTWPSCSSMLQDVLRCWMVLDQV